MLEQLKSADWKKQTVEVVAGPGVEVAIRQAADFDYNGAPCRVYLAQYGEGAHCKGRWNVQVSVGYPCEVRTSELVDSAEAGLELATRFIPVLHAAHLTLKGG